MDLSYSCFLLKQQLIVNQMKANLPRINREISFSQSFQYYNDYEKTNYQSPTIAIQQKIPSTSRHKNHYRQLSPLSNQKNKYLNTTRVATQFEDQQSSQTQTARERYEISDKKQNFSQINKRIKQILIEIQDQEKGKNQLNDISQNKCGSPSDYGKIKSIKKLPPQKAYLDQLCFNNQNKYFKRGKQKQKQNQFCTLTRLIDKINQANCKNINNLEIKNSQKSALAEKMIDSNNVIFRKTNQVSRSISCRPKKPGHENFAQNSNNYNRENAEIVIKEKNIAEQLQIIDRKIKELQGLKKQFYCELPRQKNNEQKDMIESKLTKNSSLLTIKTKQLSIDIHNEILQEPCILQFQSKCQQKVAIVQKKLVTQAQICNKEREVLIQDIRIPKILKKIKDKKKEKLKETSSAENSNILYSRGHSSQFNNEYYYDIQQNRNSVINQKNNLLNELQYQIKLDDEFRKAKKWLQKIKINNKWSLVMDQLQKNLYYITETQIKNVFSLVQDQENPFYYPQETDFTLEECVKVFLTADRHWNYDMVHSYSQRSLLASNFNEQNIDINGKGHINIQDLTRYINSQLDTCYRNRDIYLIYHRFKTSEKLYYSKILSCLCNE